MLLVVRYVGEQFIVSLFNQFFDSFMVLFTKARTDATANDSS